MVDSDELLTGTVKKAQNFRTLGDSQAKALRLRMYVICSECARLIDLAEDNPPKRGVDGADLVRHAAEEHEAWLELLGIPS